MRIRDEREELVGQVEPLRAEACEVGAQLVGSANRDPRAYDRPDEFDVTRYAGTIATPRHLGFALGIHYCMGAALARLEGEILLTELARRVHTLEPAGDPAYRPNLLIRGLAELPITLA